MVEILGVLYIVDVPLTVSSEAGDVEVFSMYSLAIMTYIYQTFSCTIAVYKFER